MVNLVLLVATLSCSAATATSSSNTKPSFSEVAMEAVLVECGRSTCAAEISACSADRSCAFDIGDIMQHQGAESSASAVVFAAEELESDSEGAEANLQACVRKNEKAILECISHRTPNKASLVQQTLATQHQRGKVRGLKSLLRARSHHTNSGKMMDDALNDKTNGVYGCNDGWAQIAAFTGSTDGDALLDGWNDGDAAVDNCGGCADQAGDCDDTCHDECERDDADDGYYLEGGKGYEQTDKGTGCKGYCVPTYKEGGCDPYVDFHGGLVMQRCGPQATPLRRATKDVHIGYDAAYGVPFTSKKECQGVLWSCKSHAPNAFEGLGI